MPENNQPHEPLTERELEILNLIAEGLTNRQIAEKLFLALETIRWYSKRIYTKLYVRNRTQAAARAREMGLILDGSTPVSVPELPRQNLPAQVTAFVGRGQELSDLSGMLGKNDTRLVTILAPGGMGKTRLAVQVAKATIVKFPDGVVFVPLENLDSKNQIVSAITEALNIQLPVSSHPERYLLEYLQDKNILLLLDGFEKLISESALVSKLLAHAPKLKALVTSRERLNLKGENIYNLTGLDVPQFEDNERVLNSSAVKLFIQSAKLVRPNFMISDDDLPHLIQICRLVEGMPLGILLAAAWIEVLSPEEIENEIIRNLDFLKTEKYDVPERQKSIQVVFDYSLDLLQEGEKSIFKKLSVFQGSFTRKAAFEVAGAEVANLASFVEKSLLQFDSSHKRYRLHELLRQYALQRLEQDHLLHETYDAHKDYYAAYLMQVEDDIKGPDQLNAFDRVQAELDNIRMAWNWAVNQNEYGFVDKALESLYWFCINRGRVPDGEELFQRARKQFAQPPEIQSEPRRRRLFIRFNASGDEYKAQLERALSLSREDAGISEAAFLLWAYGVNGYVMQDFNRAIEALEESLLMYQELNDQYYSVEILHLLWICNNFLGNMDKAAAYYHQALETSRANGYKMAVARALGSAGAFQFMSGDYGKAEESSREALELRREIKDHSGEAMSLAMLSWLVSLRGDLEQAKVLAETGLKIAAEVNSLNSKMTAMNVLGWIACLEDDFEYAIELCNESFTHAPDPTVEVAAELVLAYAACGIEDYEVSRKHLRNVLDFCLSIDGYGLMFISLPVIALNLADRGERDLAAEIIGICLSFPPSYIGWLEKSNLTAKLFAHQPPEPGEKESQLDHDGGSFEGLVEVIKFTLGVMRR